MDGEGIQLRPLETLSELLRERNRRALQLGEADLEVEACLAALMIVASDGRPHCENEPPREVAPAPTDRVRRYLARFRPGRHGVTRQV